METKEVVGKHCTICKTDMEANCNRTGEDIIAEQNFLYPKAIVAEINCKNCNVDILGSECESEFFNDPIIQQAKMSLYPISLREDKSGWIINSKIAYHHKEPGLHMPSEEVWRAIGKTMLGLVALRVGNKVFNQSLDPLRNFIRFGGPYKRELGLFRGPLNRDGRWQAYHIVRTEFFSDDSFIIQVDFFGRYGFAYLCSETCGGNDRKWVEVRIGALEKRWERVVVFRDGRELSYSGQIPPFYSARFLKKFYGYG